MVHVFLYVPNIIGYVRVALALASMFFALAEPWKFVAIYSFSMWLDAVDGVAARALKQTSRFGAVLDMVTDRFTSAILLAVLSHVYVAQLPLFLGLMVLDIGSHWCQMYSSLVEGGDSHKSSVSNPLLKFYYSFPYALFFLCVFNEGGFVALYLLHATTGPVVLGLPLVTAGFYFCLPFVCFKQLINVVQLFEAASKLAAADTKPLSARD